MQACENHICDTTNEKTQRDTVMPPARPPPPEAVGEVDLVQGGQGVNERGEPCEIMFRHLPPPPPETDGGGGDDEGEGGEEAGEGGDGERTMMRGNFFERVDPSVLMATLADAAIKGEQVLVLQKELMGLADQAGLGEEEDQDCPGLHRSQFWRPAALQTELAERVEAAAPGSEIHLALAFFTALFTVRCLLAEA